MVHLEKQMLAIFPGQVIIYNLKVNVKFQSVTYLTAKRSRNLIMYILLKVRSYPYIY